MIYCDILFILMGMGKSMFFRILNITIIKTTMWMMMVLVQKGRHGNSLNLMHTCFYIRHDTTYVKQHWTCLQTCILLLFL